MKNIIFTYGLILTVLGGACGWMTAYSYWGQRNQAMEAVRESTDMMERAIIAVAEANEAIEMYLSERDGDWETLIEALIFVESSGDPDAIGDGGKAVGVLQIHPSWIDDLRGHGYDFTLDDRYNREKSIEIFNAYQKIYNPEKSIERAIHLHNPGAGVKYRDRIIENMYKLKNETP